MYMYVCVYIYIYRCMYVFMYVCMYNTHTSYIYPTNISISTYIIHTSYHIYTRTNMQHI